MAEGAEFLQAFINYITNVNFANLSTVYPDWYWILHWKTMETFALFKWHFIRKPCHWYHNVSFEMDNNTVFVLPFQDDTPPPLPRNTFGTNAVIILIVQTFQKKHWLASVPSRSKVMWYHLPKIASTNLDMNHNNCVSKCTHIWKYQLPIN